MNIALWVAQVLLAVVFFGHAFIKFVLPAGLPDALAWVYDIPREANIAIGVVELLAAIGLLLPAALRIRPYLTWWAAAGLMMVMVGAAVFHIARGEYAAMVTNVVIFIVAGFVAYGRARLRPISPAA